MGGGADGPTTDMDIEAGATVHEVRQQTAGSRNLPCLPGLNVA